MASASSLTFRLFGEDVSASRTLDKVGVKAEETSAKFGRLGAAGGAALAGIAVAAGAVGAASVKLAMDFDQQMARLSTQAGVPQAKLKGLSDSVLNLAGQVGFSPKSLAESLYHVESAFSSMGITSQKAMDIVKTAAQGAAIGGSDLVDTTNALTATIASGIKGAQDYQQAMGALNATVGSGDMSMQDLADAINTGFLSVVKSFGVTLADTSAALATFGDAGIRGAEAGTGLRQAIQAMAHPAATGKAALDSVGLSTKTLAQDMAHGGLNQALKDLVTHMTNAGVTGNQVGSFITDAFGKKSSAALGILVEQFQRFQSKYAEADKQAHTFASAWQQQQQQFSQVLKDLEAGAEAIGIRIGNFLIPKIMVFGKAVGDAWHSLNQQAGGQQSILKEFMTGFNNQSMTNFDSGFGGALEHIGVSIHNFLDAAQKLGTELYQALLPAFKDVWTFIQQSLWPSLQNLWQIMQNPLTVALGILVGAFKVLAGFLKDVVGPALSGTTRFLKDHKTIVDALIIVLGSMWVAWKGYKIIESAVIAIRAATVAMTAFDIAADANPIGLVVIAVAGLAAGVYELWTHWNQVWGWIQHHKAYAAIILAVTSIAAPFVPITVGLVWLAKNWHDVWTSVATFFLKIADGILVGFKGLVDGIYTMVENILQAASHLPYVGHHFANMERGVKQQQANFDGDMNQMITGIHSLIDNMNSVPPMKRVTFTSDGVPNVVADIATINTALDKIGSSYVVSVGGGTGRKLINADGGHYAQIGNGVTRVWNEPETGGEAYIPLAPSKRARSIDIWAQTGKSLGVFANGGIIAPTNVQVDTMGIGNSLFGGYGGLFGGGNVGYGSGAAQWAGAVTQVLGMLGLSALLLPKVLSQIQTESGGNPNAINLTDSNARAGHPSMGLMQTIMSTFLAYAGPFAGLGPFNAFADIYAGVNYAAHRYGPNLNGLGEGHGYALGGFASGWARVGEAGPEMVYLGRGGQVISNRDSAGAMHVHIHAIDAQSVDQWLNRPGVTDKLATALSRARGRGGALAAF